MVRTSTRPMRICTTGSAACRLWTAPAGGAPCGSSRVAATGSADTTGIAGTDTCVDAEGGTADGSARRPFRSGTRSTIRRRSTASAAAAASVGAAGSGEVGST
jgi:hypothetical protein